MILQYSSTSPTAVLVLSSNAPPNKAVWGRELRDHPKTPARETKALKAYLDQGKVILFSRILIFSPCVLRPIPGSNKQGLSSLSLHLKLGRRGRFKPLHFEPLIF